MKKCRERLRQEKRSDKGIGGAKWLRWLKKKVERAERACRNFDGSGENSQDIGISVPRRKSDSIHILLVTFAVMKDKK